MKCVSIIITNHNYGRFLGRCIRSCLDQSLPLSEYEIIIVDDNSDDNSIEVINSYLHHQNVSCIRLEKNMGVSYASNIGIRRAISPYVIRVDADDYINHNTLLIFSEILKWNSDISFVYGDIIRVNDKEEKCERINTNSINNLFKHGAGIMFRKSCLEAVGLYDESIRNAEDFDLILRVMKNFDGYHVKLPTYRYYRHDNNMTNDLNAREDWEQLVNNKHGVNIL
ncbi:hypothetical protein AOA80_04440 [Methanomassiliicoccales archaeon RumEn M1]|nr:hypothetical protein AOA80_04440 [Methanomassiliicoccales archaeon RumEn M1]